MRVIFVFICDNSFSRIANYHSKQISQLGHSVEILRNSECLNAIEIFEMEGGYMLPSSDRIPKFVYSKVILPYIFPDYDRIVYLDSDTSIDYSKLHLFYDLNFDNPVAMVPHIGSPKKIDKVYKKYFNSGVVVINTKSFLKVLSSPLPKIDPLSIVFEDQCLLNILFFENIFELDTRFNFMPDHFFYSHEICKNPIIIHHTGMFGKPGNWIRWGVDGEDHNVIQILSSLTIYRESGLKVSLRLLGYLAGLYRPYHRIVRLGVVRRFIKLSGIIKKVP